MRIAQVLAGFTLAEADVLRKAVGKKDAELIRQQLGMFVEQAEARGVDGRTATEIAEQIETFGRYGFNRSHSVAYALLSYQTAWLKRYHPAEFMAALLSSVIDRTDDVVKYIGECREVAHYSPDRPDGIAVLPPDVNESDWKFTPIADDQVRFGLGAIRGLGGAAVRSILDARAADGPFESLFGLAERIDLRTVAKRALEALIQAGACDGIAERLPSGAPHRAQLFGGLDATVGEAQLRAEERVTGQGSLFDAVGGGQDEPGGRPAPRLPEVAPWSETERLAKEKEALGFFISGHPLDKFREEVEVFGDVNAVNLVEHRDRKVELACVVTDVSAQISKRTGSEWGRVTVEDFQGTATLLVFGEAWERHRDVLRPDTAVLVRGTVSGRERDEDSPPIFLDEAVPLASVRTSGRLGLELRIAADAADVDAIGSATAALREHGGESPVYVRWYPRDAAGGESGSGRAEDGARSAAAVGDSPSSNRRNGGGVAFRSRSLRVAPSEQLLERLRELFGADRIRLVKDAQEVG